MCGLRRRFSARRKARRSVQDQEPNRGRCPNPPGEIFPCTPSQKLPQPPQFLRGLPRRLAGQNGGRFDKPRGSWQSESVNSLSSFRYRFIPVPLTDTTSSFLLSKKKKRRAISSTSFLFNIINIQINFLVQHNPFPK